MSSASPEPGWYENPEGPGLRWWDGSAWTEHVHREDGPSAATGGEASPDAEALLAMYAARRPSPSAEEPSYRGYKTMLVVLALAVVAIVIGLILIGGGDEEGADEASGARAAELARTAQTAIETYAAENGGSYLGAGPEQLVAIEPALEGADIELTSDATSYSLTVTDGESAFSVTRAADSSISFSCQPEGTVDCPPGGDWSQARQPS